MSDPILLLGNQNAGKSTLFNAMTGLKSRVANYPGVTVEARIGEVMSSLGQKICVVDLPGTYSLLPASMEEELALRALFGDLEGLARHSLVVVVVDCTELRRGLYLYSQVIELGFQAIIALSMVDQRPELFNPKGVASLARSVGTLVVPVSTSDKPSVKRLIAVIDGILSGSLKPQIRDQPLLYSSLPEELVDRLGGEGVGMLPLPLHAKRSVDLIRNHNVFLYGLAKRWRLNKTMDDLSHVKLTKDDVVLLDGLLAHIPEQRFMRVDGWIAHLKKNTGSRARAISDGVDRVLLRPVLGTVFLLTIFVVMLSSMFLIAAPMADMMAEAVGYVGSHIGSLLPAGSRIHSLVMDGVLAGVGSILSFIPLIALLFLFIALLEDSGYLARATFLLDNTLKKVGLCGRSLMPMLSSFACAVPAIMATRTIGDRKQRLITIMVMPFLTCSARLPVFALIVGALFVEYPPLWGVIHVGALVFILMYALGIVASITAAFILSKIIRSDGAQGLSIELPPYRWPAPLSIVKRVADRIYLFLRDVGSIILASTVIIWCLFNFEVPSSTPIDTEVVGDVTMGQGTESLPSSYASVIGHKMEPLMKPLGLDWRVGMGVLASLLAREVFVSTMAVVYGLSSSMEDDDVGLKRAFASNISPLSGICLLIFFTLSLQCISTMAATFRETGSYLWPVLQFFIMSGSGYLLALLTYGVGRALGFA